jgi:AcrR family transcriptional regulator
VLDYEHLVRFRYTRRETVRQQPNTPKLFDIEQSRLICSRKGNTVKKKALPDRRIQRTRQLLLDSLIQLILEKGYETITVQDIIDRANVGRSTFYAHFQDKEDLLLSGFENMRDMFEGFQNQSSPEAAGWNFSLALFQHAEEQRPGFKALLGKSAGVTVLNHLKKALTTVLKEHFQTVFPKKKQPMPLDLFVEYMVGTLLGILIWWLDNDIAQPAEKLNEYFQALTEPTIQVLIGNS